jgi:hypothetical protein
MDPCKWMQADSELEMRLEQCIDWYDACEIAIKHSTHENHHLVKQLKDIFLNTVNLNDINDYLCYYRPHKLSVSKLIKIEEEVMNNCSELCK